jgi:DNA repair protein RadC
METQPVMPEIQLRYRTSHVQKVTITHCKEAFNVLYPLFDQDTIEYQETFIVVFLNRANETIGWLRLSQGGMTGTVVDNKILFATALKCGASGIILSHNHPSGKLKPSHSDIVLTNKIVEVAKLLEITVLDHLIITRDGHFSFCEDGILNERK